ncbi:unnamed protein product [Candidula unifasciata]|uniref:C2H2-type domain-containing protein n=1 Tax=Candidula unifasciata TaxID=100452 RepID=A0A8S3Z2U9_9EUPU|nr:unnamed protein product [Candidula unifasciata]
MLSNFTNVAGSPELANYRNQFSLSADDKPTPFMDVTGSHALLEPSFARQSRRAERAHNIRGVSNAVSDKKLWSPTTCNQLRGKPLYFSPYSREKMADLAAKFMVARGSKLVGEKGRVSVKSAGEKEKKKVGDLRQHSAPVAKVSGTSPTNTEGSCKNAILALSGQAHQENDTVGSEYSNMETSLRYHIPTVVKSEPLKEQDANAGSPLDFRCRAWKAYGDESRSSVGDSHNCDMCREVFRTFLELEDHSVEVHKRYLCEHCKKGFTARPNRDRHVRYHTGERPYKCDLCDLAFFRGDDLKYHRTTRHPTAQPFVCPRCSASFTWGRDLEKHIRHSKCKV